MKIITLQRLYAQGNLKTPYSTNFSQYKKVKCVIFIMDDKCNISIRKYLCNFYRDPNENIIKPQLIYVTFAQILAHKNFYSQGSERIKLLIFLIERSTLDIDCGRKRTLRKIYKIKFESLKPKHKYSICKTNIWSSPYYFDRKHYITQHHFLQFTYSKVQHNIK